MTEKAPGFVERFKAKVRNGMDRLKDRFSVFKAETNAEANVVAGSVASTTVNIVEAGRNVWGEAEGNGLRRFFNAVVESSKNLGDRIKNVAGRARHEVEQRGIIGSASDIVGKAVVAVVDLPATINAAIASFQEEKVVSLHAQMSTEDAEAAHALLKKTYDHVDKRRAEFQANADAHRAFVDRVRGKVDSLKQFLFGKKTQELATA